jgi:hypothetical protein
LHVLEAFSEAENLRLRHAVGSLSAYAESLQVFQANNEPTADSAFAQGNRENGGIWWREAGDLALAASFDHLQAFITLLSGDVPRQAGYSVLRGSAEAAAIAWWLFDPAVTEQERVQRGFEERLYGMHVQRGLVEKKDKPKLEAIHKAIVAKAAPQGLSEEPDSQAKGLTHFGRPRLSIQDLLIRVLPEKRPESELTNGEWLWRSLSAFGHSEIWTSVAGLREVEDDTKPRLLVVNLDTLFPFAELTITAHDKAFSRRMLLAGHPTWEQQRGALPVL